MVEYKQFGLCWSCKKDAWLDRFGLCRNCISPHNIDDFIRDKVKGVDK
jgi:hypothetical protein